MNGINVNIHRHWNEMCQHLRDMEVDVALFAEHKLDTTQPRALGKLYDAARQVFGLGLFAINATSTPIESPTMYNPGVVMPLTHGNILGRILNSGQDPLGCWTYTTFRRSTGPPLTVIATYQVVEVDPCHAGPTTYATQLYSLYLKEGRQQPENLRAHHATDLTNLIKAHQERGKWIIIVGDLNKVLGVVDQGMTKLHHKCGLIDACLATHGTTNFSTYHRGTKVIDYELVDANVMQCIQSIGYEPFNIHIMSNHLGLFLDLATPQCFGSNILPLQPLQKRDLPTKRSYQIQPYFQAKDKHLQDHNWLKRIKELSQNMRQDMAHHELAKDLNERLIAASIYAVLTLKKFPPAPYSPMIARL